MDFSNNDDYRYSDDHSFGSMDDFDAVGMAAPPPAAPPATTDPATANNHSNNNNNNANRTGENPFKVSYGSLTTNDEDNGDDDDNDNNDEEENDEGVDNGFNAANGNNNRKDIQQQNPAPAPPATADSSSSNSGDIFDDFDENDGGGGGGDSSGSGHDQQHLQNLQGKHQHQHQPQQPYQQLPLGSAVPSGSTYGNIAAAANGNGFASAPPPDASHTQEQAQDSHGQQYSYNFQQNQQLQHLEQEQRRLYQQQQQQQRLYQQQQQQQHQQQQYLQPPTFPTGHSFTNGMENSTSSVLELSRQQQHSQQQQQQPNFETISNQGKKQSSPFTNEDTSSKDELQQPSNGDQSFTKPSGQKQEEPVIEILDDDSDDEDNDENKANVKSNGFNSSTAGVKRSREEESDVASSSNSNKAARHHDGTKPQLSSENVASAREASLASKGGTNGAAASIAVGTGGLKVGQPGQLTRYPWHKPTWEALIPSNRDMARVRQHQIDLEYERNSEKSYELSLLNMNEFTISGLPTGFLSRPCKVQGLRKTIKECSKGHGKAIFEVDKEGTSDDNPDGGKWRIPLGAYEQFLYALRARPKTTVQPIPNYQLSVASLGKARLDKGFPSTKKIIDAGVPPGLACSLADFQRGGVDFVIDKLGRALIADDMGLGKTVQGIASMAAFHEDWPLLVLTPSSARYHWEAEFMQWLGEDSVINDPHKVQEKLRMIQSENDDDDDDVVVTPKSKTSFKLLRDYQINVLKSGRDTILYPETRVVICSYGLAPSLFANNLLVPGMFKSVIVDESHYLKSMKTKRTKSILPILQKSSRCVLLSGTPALAKPSELWPQLLALKGRNGGWFQDEEDFHRKYVTRSSPARRAELHCMLTGTLMIRRMKTDMLKNLPKKHREKALVNVTDSDDRREFHRCMELLRQGKGVMANIAQKHSAFAGMGAPVAVNNNSPEFLELKAEYDLRMEEKLNSIEQASQSIEQNDASYDKEQWKQEQKLNIKAELDNWFNQRLHEINQNAQIRDEGGEEEMSRKAILNRMYGMTARAKVPLIVKMLRQWLADPTKGKLCIFAHHIYVLDELVKQAGLSNATGSTTQYIRIDGSTSPQERQNQIRRFQDPRNDKLRVAVLGITAAGIAVTLTASSTVWFAELFWTPALMIQAEDRVHRIGQTSTCKILYFVANGTLDLLLWSLLEKKFRALGEFVEGQEKMKIVVQKTYESAEILEKEYFASGRTSSKDDDKEDEEENRKMAGVVDPENAQDVNDLVSFQGQLGREIDELEREEMDLLKAAEEDEGEFMDGREGLDGSNRGSGKIGRSEHHAIDLDADGADSKAPPVTSSNAMAVIFDHRSPDAFAGCRYYMQAYENPQHRFGLELFPYDGRIMVGANQHGLQPEPESGDILVAVNGVHVPFPCPLQTVIKFMSTEIAKGNVTLWLVDGGKEWKHRFEQIKVEETERRKRLQLAHQQFQRDRLQFQRQHNPSGNSGQSGNTVIELLDDSDDE